MTKIKKSKTSISILDLIRTRVFQFHLQRWVIFITVFVISFISLWNFDFFEGTILSKIKNDWPSLAWKFYLLLALFATARPTAKYIAESYNRNIYAWIATLIFIGYASSLYIFTHDSQISSVSTIRLNYLAWAMPGIAIPIVSRLMGVLLTHKVSPIQMQKNLYGLALSIFTAGISISTTLIGYYIAIEKNSFSLDKQIYQILISTIILCFMFATLFGVLSWYRYKKIKFNNQNISIPLIVILPIFTSVLAWMFKGTFNANLNMTPELWFLIAATVLVVLLVVFTIFFAKEIRVAKIMNTVFSSSLLLIWIGVFTYVKYFGVVNDSYVVVDIAAASSMVVFFLMAVYDRSTKMGAVQESIFSIMIVIMMLLIVFFTIIGKARLFDELFAFAPVDLKSLLPVLLIAMPGVYFIMSIFKIMWAQSRITHGIRIDKAITKRKKLEKQLSIDLEKGEKYA